MTDKLKDRGTWICTMDLYADSKGKREYNITDIGNVSEETLKAILKDMHSKAWG